MKPDLSSWLTSQEAAKHLGVAYRTLLDMVRRGKLHPRKLTRAGKPGAVSMFDPAEVEALVSQRIAEKTDIVPASDPGPLPAVIHADVQPAYHLPNGPLAAAIAGREQFLTIEDAAVYIGLPYAELDRLVKSGELPARKAGRWYIRRRDLDKL